MQSLIHDQMYPQFSPGLKARVAVLIVLLAFVIIVSFTYLFLNVRSTRRKGRDVWIARLVRRPAGRYLALNQYIIYPALSIVLSASWIAFAAYIYEMFGPSYGNPRSLFLWLSLGWLPFFALLSVTTYSTTSAANLASRGRKPGTHRLSPFFSGLICAILLPVVLGVVTGVGIWTGSRWYRFATRWQRAYNYLGQQADVYTGGAPDAAAVETASALLLGRCETAQSWADAQLTNSIIYIVVSAVLIFMNVFAGLYLLSSLRQIDDRHLVVPRGTPLVAPLEPLPATTLHGDTATLADVCDAGQPAAWEEDAAVSKLKVHRLRWDVTLFFFSVVPSLLAFIAYAAWLGTRLWQVMWDAPRFEFACLGMIWIYAAVSLACLSALTIKTILSLRNAARQNLPDSASYMAESAQWRRRAMGVSQPATRESSLSSDEGIEIDSSHPRKTDEWSAWSQKSERHEWKGSRQLAGVSQRV
ncbi:hypothetical protein Rhopal_003202-T1 [Rhodotorula paludigena]|uniref:Proteophosphoglycan ppg4 n=1 Tax=Rhodotorula paludigena TaxID=86838 RepID=A0AAV5GND6_9BASI|nr:hypothetical protein Rhopal_003202-T1 [Rhodotorula paludigena]